MRRKLNYSVAILFILLSGCGRGQNAAEDSFKKGFRYEKSHSGNAMAAYARAFHIDPNYTKRFFQRGLRYKNLEYMSRLVEDYIDVMRLNQREVIIGYDGVIPHYYESPEEAIAHFTKLIQGYPGTAVFYYNRGLAFYYAGEFDKAISDFSKVIELNSSYADAYYRRAVSHYAKGDIKQVISDCTETVALNPAHAYAYYVRGVAYNSHNEYQKALEDFTQAINSYKNFDRAYYRRGSIYYVLVYRNKATDIDMAIKDFDMAITINPSNAEYYFSRGAAYSSYKKDFDKAINDFDKAIEISPQNHLSYYNRAKAYFEKKEYDKSLEDMTTAGKLGFKSDAKLMRQLKNFTRAGK